MTRKRKTLFTYLLVCAVAALLFLFPGTALTCAKNTLGLIATSLVPSLFPFLVLSELIIKSGLGVRAGRLFSAPAKKFLGVGSGGVCAFVCGALCGFPVGALTACTLYERGEISKKEASHLLLFCNNTGPGFLISGVGTALFGSARFGVLLYAVQIISALIIGAASKRFFPYEKNSGEKPKTLPLVGAPLFTEAIKCAAKNMLTVCGYILFFSVISGILSSFLPAAAISGLFEISSGCVAASLLASSGAPAALAAAVCAFIVGWSGLSVHAQTAAICKNTDLPLFPYVAAKFVQGVLSALFVFLYFTLFPVQSLSVFAAAGNEAEFVPLFVSYGVNILFIFGVLKNLIKKGGKKRFYVI